MLGVGRWFELSVILLDKIAYRQTFNCQSCGLRFALPRGSKLQREEKL
jgi:transcription elongation factor Elf1